MAMVRKGDVVMPKVSVILPVYNVEKYLAECLDSIRAQTLKDIEIIAVDDGSTDGSLAVLRKYAQTEPRLKVISRKNGGAGAARNTGMDQAKGKYLFFHDPDDFSRPQMLERLVATAEAAAADVVVAGRCLYDDKTKAIVKTIHLPAHVMACPNAFTYRDVAGRFFSSFGFAPWNKLFRREFVLQEKLRYQELPRNNDMYFILVSLIAAKRIAALDEAYYCYRTNVATSLQANNDRTPLVFVDAWMAIKQKLQEYGAYEAVYNSFCLGVVHSSFERLLSLKNEYNFRMVYDRLRKEIFPTLFNGRRLTPEVVNNGDLFEQYVACMDNENPLMFMMARNRRDTRMVQKFNAAADVAEKLRGQVAQLKQQIDADKAAPAKMAALEKRAKDLAGSLAAAQQRIKTLEAKIESLASSASYRIGLIVTCPVRKARGGVKCLRDNGVKYTLKHAVGKVLRKCGSKVTW